MSFKCIVIKTPMEVVGLFSLHITITLLRIFSLICLIFLLTLKKIEDIRISLILDSNLEQILQNYTSSVKLSIKRKEIDNIYPLRVEIPMSLKSLGLETKEV